MGFRHVLPGCDPPTPESLDLALLTCTEKGAPAAHSYPTPHTPIGVRRNMANMCVGVAQSSIDTPRSAGTSESSRFGEEDAPPATEGDRILPVALKEFLRMEVRAASIDAERPYVRCPHSCPICPMRKFPELRRIRSHIAKDHGEDKDTGAPSSRALRLDIALFNRDHLVCASGSLVGKLTKRCAYLARAGNIVAAWMRECVDLCGEFPRGDIAQLDRHIRLCLTTVGPI